MDRSFENAKRAEFRDILFALAKDLRVFEDKNKRRDWYIRFEKLYLLEGGNRYRHFYADIFSVLTEINNNPSFGTIEVLGSNLCFLREHYLQEDSSKDVSDSIKKLYDHVSLEISHITYSERLDQSISQQLSVINLKSEIEALREKFVETEGKLAEAEDKLEKANHKISNSQKEYIAILGIFASAVLAFSGGLSFTTSTLSSVANSNIIALICIVSLAGFVLLNILFVLFSYIDGMINKEPSIKSSRVINFVLITIFAVSLIITLITQQ